MRWPANTGSAVWRACITARVRNAGNNVTATLIIVVSILCILLVVIIIIIVVLWVAGWWRACQQLHRKLSPPSYSCGFRDSPEHWS